MENNKNYKYIQTGDYECDKVEATIDEIINGRKLFTEAAEKDSVAMRTCWECNSAHAHLMSDFIFVCIECGRYFANGIDVLDYDDECE